MKEELWLEKYVSQFKDDVEFITEELIIELTEKIVSRMEEINLSRAELAKRLGVSKAFVTKVLNGNPNLTLKTIVSISKALDCKVDIDLCPSGYETRKFYIKKQKSFEKDYFKKDFISEISEEVDASAA